MSVRYIRSEIKRHAFPKTFCKMKNRDLPFKAVLNSGQDGGRVRHGDHLASHRYIRNTSTRGTVPTEHPLNAGRRRQTSQKARNSPTYLGRAKEKRNNRDKRIGTAPAPVGGSCEGGKVSTH